jgi:glutamine amidotransferase
MKVAIIKYNAGNVQSVFYALDRLGVSYLLTDDEAEIRSADKVILPGVGEAGSTMRSLRQQGLDRVIPTLKQPFLGTCVGLQLMCRHSQEANTDCLGIFDITVKRFPTQPGFKVPHVGWNTISGYRTPLTYGLPDEAYVYYVHSYYAELSPYTVAQTEYLVPFSAMLHRDNFYAAQFHAEISGEAGSKILRNFLEI